MTAPSQSTGSKLSLLQLARKPGNACRLMGRLACSMHEGSRLAGHGAEYCGAKA
jgi:hypothetical protein